MKKLCPLLLALTLLLSGCQAALTGSDFSLTALKLTDHEKDLLAMVAVDPLLLRFEGPVAEGSTLELGLCYVDQAGQWQQGSALLCQATQKADIAVSAIGDHFRLVVRSEHGGEVIVPLDQPGMASFQLSDGHMTLHADDRVAVAPGTFIPLWGIMGAKDGGLSATTLDGLLAMDSPLDTYSAALVIGLTYTTQAN